jgi:putative membrane protein
MLAVVGGSWQQLLQRDDLGLAGLVVLGLLVAGGAYGLASWVRTTYWIDDDELRIDTGVVMRQSRRIRIDRLQGIDIVQPLVARLFGLAELRFDLAAGGEREGRLAFLPHTEALEVRRRLLQRRDDLRGEPRSVEGQVRADPPERPLARLDLGRLLVSLALSGEGVWAVLGTVVLLGLAATTGELAIIGGLVPALLALGLSVGNRLTSYYGFTLAESTAGLHVRRGLTSVSSQTIAPARIQGFVVSEPLLWRRMGWARLEVSVAGYRSIDPDAAEASSTLLPVAPLEEVLALLRHVMQGRDATAVPLVRPPRRAAWLAPLTSWNLAVGQDAELLVSRRGWWKRRLDVVPHARVQSVHVSQGPLQRWLRLADAHVDSPPGPVHVRAVQCDEGVARGYLADAVARARAARHVQSAPPGLPGDQRRPDEPHPTDQPHPGYQPEPADRAVPQPTSGSTPPAPESNQ